VQERLLRLQQLQQTLQSILAQKQQELEVHDKSKPLEVTKPDNDPIKQKEIADVAAAIEEAKEQLIQYEEKIGLMKEEQAKLTLTPDVNSGHERLSHAARCLA
jgi:predicted DNA-binding protein YlxM (UPF0122 family)